MRRRALLGALTGGLAGLAGCQGFGGGSDGRDTPYDVPPRETTTETTTEPIPGVDPSVDPDPVDPPVRTVSTQVGAGRSLAIADWPLSRYPGQGRYTVGFTTPPSLTTPATVFVAFTSTTDQPREYEFGPSPPFSNYLGVRTDGDQPRPGLVLVPMDGRPFPYDDPTPGVPTNGRWVATEGLGSPTGEVEARSVELAPGESVVGKYLLLRYPGAGEFPRRVTYSFGNGGWAEPTLSISVWDPTLRTARQSRFEDRTLPDLPYVEPTQWYHRNGGEEGTAYLEPPRERVELPRAVLSPTVENFSSVTVGADVLSLFKYRDGRWYRVAPLEREATSPRYVAPGGSLGWVVSVNNDPESNASTDPSVPSTTVPRLGAGVYAVGTVASGISERSNTTAPVLLGSEVRAQSFGDESTVLGALVELAGSSLELERSPNATFVDREDDVVTLRLEPPGTPQDWSPTTVLNVVLRSSEYEAGEGLIPEQVYQMLALRNALASFEGDVEAVRVRTSEALARRPMRAFGDGNLLRFSYEGATYLGRARPIEDDGTGE